MNFQPLRFQPLRFQQLNRSWNAEPNAPSPTVRALGSDVLPSFVANAMRYREFDEDDTAMLRFSQCARYRLGATNDEGWYAGACRFSKLAPAWGDFLLRASGRGIVGGIVQGIVDGTVDGTVDGIVECTARPGRGCFVSRSASRLAQALSVLLPRPHI